MAKKCPNSIEIYKKGPRTHLPKVAIIQDVTSTLTAATLQFTETEINDALGSYLKIIAQCDESIEAASAQAGVSNSETLEESSVFPKRVLSPEPATGTGKR